MPYMQTMSAVANAEFARDKLPVLRERMLNDPTLLATGSRLGDMAAQLGIPMNQPATDFLNTCPSGITSVIRSAAVSGIAQGLQVTWAWMPGYDWEVTVSESRDTDTSDGGITILIRSRYPNDQRPGRP